MKHLQPGEEYSQEESVMRTKDIVIRQILHLLVEENLITVEEQARAERYLKS